MDLNSDEYQLKELLVNLEQEHKHLQASTEHLANNVVQRELEVRKLLADRELELAKAAAKKTTNLAGNHQLQNKITKSQSVDFDRVSRTRPIGDNKFSSEYSKQVSELLDRITKTSEEVFDLVKF